MKNSREAETSQIIDARAALANYVRAVASGDIESQLNFFSESWVTGSGRTKENVRRSLAHGDSKKPARDKTFEFEDSKITMDGGKVIFDPVINRSGGLFEIIMQEEKDGVWRCTFLGPTRAVDTLAEGGREAREALLEDPFRPTFHFVCPEGIAMPFDPNGAIYWRGRYHLFYIFQDSRSGVRSDHWGHVSSADLFHWRHHPTSLIDGMYSGNCFVNREGNPTICYHQVGLGNSIAISLDESLDRWEKLESNPITPHTVEGDQYHGKYSSWDPFAWVEKGNYYAIFGGSRPAIVKSKKLDGEWKYVGDLFAHGIEGVDLEEDVSCPELFPLGSKYVLLCISHRLGCRYYIGDWRDEKFYPETHGSMSWVDNSFFAPESLLDDKGRRIMWAWIMDEPHFGVRMKSGWSGTLSLPRVLSLDENSNLMIEVPQEIESLRYDEFSVSESTIGSDRDLLIEGLYGNQLEIELELSSDDADSFGIKVCVSETGTEETLIGYDYRASSLFLDTSNSGPQNTPKAVESAPLSLALGDPLHLRIFIDRSVVEVFANRRQAIARRIYPADAASLSVKLFSRGGDTRLTYLKSWKIHPSNAS